MVKRKGNIYHFRLHVPTDLQDDVGCREISRSLKTGTPRDAKRRAASIDAGAQRLWQQVRLMKRRLTPDEIKGLVAAWLDRELQQYADPAFAPLWLTSSRNAEELGFLLDELHDRRARFAAAYSAPTVGYSAKDDKLALGAPNEGTELTECREVAGKLLAEHGLDDADDESRLYLVRQVADAMQQVTVTQIDTACKVFGLPEPAAPALPAPVVVAAPAPPAASDAPLLSQVMNQRLKELRQKSKAGNRSPATVDAYEREIPFLLKLLGDRPVDQYKRDDFTDAREVLQQWPSKARAVVLKTAPSTPIDEIIGRTDLGEPLKPQTIHKLLLHITATFNFAEEAGHIIKSWVPSWEAPELDEDEEKPAFTDEQLERLFASPNYTKHAVKTSKPQYYWLPLLGLLTGKRLGELCQLYVADVVNLGGVWCIDINAAGEKRVKSRKWGKHVVPLHPKLVELGFLEHVEMMKAEGHERLWPALKFDEIRGYTVKVSTYFARYIKDHVTTGMKGQAPTFHSLRKNFASALEAAGVDDGTVSKLLGHRRANVVMAVHYSKLTPEQRAALLRPAIERLDFPALAHLRP